jgi:hypothetical protein
MRIATMLNLAVTAYAFGTVLAIVLFACSLHPCGG